MKKLIILLVLLFSVSNAFGDILQYVPQYYGEFSVTKGNSDSVLLQDTIETQAEGVLRATTVLGQGTALRSLLKGYKSDRGSIFSIEHLLLDYRAKGNRNIEYGMRVGRIPLPYGYHNDTDTSPFVRNTIITTPALVLPNNKTLFNRGDGIEFYLSSFYKNIYFYVEAGRVERISTNQLDHSFTPFFTGVDFTGMKTSFIGINFKYKNMRLRFDELNPIQTYKISKKHWTEYVKVMPESMWILGEYDTQFKTGIQAFQIYYKKSSIMLENVTFMYTDEKGWKPYYDMFRKLGKTFDRPTNNYKIVYLNHKFNRIFNIQYGNMTKLLNNTEIAGKAIWLGFDITLNNTKIRTQLLETEGKYWAGFTKSTNQDLVKDGRTTAISLIQKW